MHLVYNSRAYARGPVPCLACNVIRPAVAAAVTATGQHAGYVCQECRDASIAELRDKVSDTMNDLEAKRELLMALYEHGFDHESMSVH